MSLSIDFLKPTSLCLLFLIPLLLLLYMLKLRRKTCVVSSNLLWEEAVEDMKANTFFQRLRRNLLLPLQIIFLVLAIFALARPFFRGAVSTAQNTILIMDASASMKATDIGGTRFEAAKSVALKMVDELGDRDRIMIIEAALSPRIALGFTADKLQLKDALNKMQPADTSTDLTSAVRLASSIAKDMQKSEILILSDGASKLKKEEPGRINAQVRFIGFGRKDPDNVGITDFEVAGGTSERQIFIALQNFSKVEKRSLLLELYHDEELIDVRELSLSPRERRSVIFDDIRYTEGVIKAVIDAKDDLDVDNCAYCILREPETLRVLLVSVGNPFIENALRTSSSRIQLSRERPESYSARKDSDVVVFDGFIPARLPGKNMIIVNTEANPPFGRMLSYKDSSAIVDWDRSHPVMRFVDLSNLQIGRLWCYEMPPWMKPLAESDAGALIWIGENNGQRIILLPFEVQASQSSNFPLLAAFPIFIHNALNWLAGSDAESPCQQAESGELVKLTLPEAIAGQDVVVRKPNGEEVKVRPDGRYIVFGDTDEAGIYEVTGNGVKEKFAVSLLDESESSIEPADRIEVAGQEIASSAASTVSNREIWAVLVFVALLLLAAEWWVYHRRVLV